MNCFYHHDLPAIGSCGYCHRGVCAACAGEAAGVVACNGRCEAAVGGLYSNVAKGAVGIRVTVWLYYSLALLLGVPGLVMLGFALVLGGTIERVGLGVAAAVLLAVASGMLLAGSRIRRAK